MWETLIERRIQDLAFKSSYLSIRGWFYDPQSDAWQTTNPEAIAFFIEHDSYCVIDNFGIKAVSLKIEEAFSYEAYKK